MARWRRGNAGVCKTSIRRFDSDPRLHSQMKKAVAVIFQNENKEILLLKRGLASKGEVGLWENLGGKVNDGEDGEAAIRRECFEELGVRVENLTELFTAQENRSEVTVFKGAIQGTPVIQEGDKCSELRWFSQADLKSLPLASYTRNDFVKLGWLT